MIWCDRELVSNPYYFGLCLSPKKFRKELKRVGATTQPGFIKTPQANATTWFLEDREGKPLVIVCMRDHEKRDQIEVFGLLVHEAVHIWQAVKDNIGERAPSEEFEAYSIQAISQQLMCAYLKLSK